MASLFADAGLNLAGVVGGAAQNGMFGTKVQTGVNKVITAAGAISPEAAASIAKNIAGNGTPAQPQIVQTGIRRSVASTNGTVAKVLDRIKANKYAIGLAFAAVVAFVVFKKAA